MPSLLTSWSAMVCYDVLSEGHTKGTHLSTPSSRSHSWAIA
jgi:hypothetical protein